MGDIELVRTNAAGLIIGGILGLIVGGALWTYGLQVRLVETLGRSLFTADNPGQAQILWGVALTIAGLVALLMGLGRLASNVELIAFRVVRLRPAVSGSAQEQARTPVDPADYDDADD